MGQFGEDLRKEREARGIALETIVEETKIGSRHLLSLEHEDFDALPGGVFNKGIVRSYVQVVGLDEDAWLARYQAAYESSGHIKQDDADWIEFAENVSRSREVEDAGISDARLRWTGVAVLLLLVGGLGWYVWHYVSTKLYAQVSTPPTVTASIHAGE